MEHPVHKQTVGWFVNRKGFGRKRSWLNWATVSTFVWRDWGGTRKTSVWIIWAEIRTKPLQTTSVERYRYAQLLGNIVLYTSRYVTAFTDSLSETNPVWSALILYSDQVSRLSIRVREVDIIVSEVSAASIFVVQRVRFWIFPSSQA
jgi:hypothetical protein